MKIIWVSSNTGSDTTGDGSREKPYATIEKGLQDFTSGDELRILEGDYAPPNALVLDGLDGSIFAEGPQTVNIQPLKTTTHQAGLAILNSKRFLLAGVNILQAVDNSGNLFGIYAEDVENFICLTCAVYDFDVPSGQVRGIYAKGSGRVEDCKVANFLSAGDMMYGIVTVGVDIIECEVDNLSGVGDVKGIRQFDL